MSVRRLKANRVWLSLLLITGSLIAYAPALDGEPLWDDTFLVGVNPFFRSYVFVFEVFRHWLFPDSLAAYYRPVQNWSYTIDYLIWRGNPFGYHLSNVILHGLAAVLLFVLLDNILGQAFRSENSADEFSGRWVAFGVAAIWVIHPIHNAAVAYIAGRADSLAAVFALSGWFCYRAMAARFTGSRRRRIALLLLSWGFGLLALCSKEIAIVWIALFLVLEGWPLWKQRKGMGLAIAVTLLLGLYIGLRRLPGPGHSAESSAEPFAGRVILSLRALGDYTRLLFWPVNLHMCRQVYTPAQYANGGAWQANIGLEYLSLLGVGTVAVLITGCFKAGGGVKLRRIGALWFGIGFLPISNLFPLNAQVAEHWIYMPSIGFLLFIAGGFLEIPRAYRRAAIGLVGCAVVALILQTRARSVVWTSADKLYWSTIQSGGADARVVINFSNIYRSQGKLDKAEQLLRYVCGRWPEYPPGKIDLGQVLIAKGHPREGEEILNTVREQQADGKAVKVAGSWNADLSLAGERLKEGRGEEALKLVDAALVRNPKVDAVIRAKMEILERLGRIGDAERVATEYASKQWWNLELQIATAKLVARAGDLDGALAVLKRAAKLDVWNSEPFSVAAELALQRGRTLEALSYAERAVERNQGLSTYVLLARVYQRLHRESDAEAVFEKAAEFKKKVHAG